MFFNLTTSARSNFSHTYQLTDNLVLNTDDGWEAHTVDGITVVIKGYANQLSNDKVVALLLVDDIPYIKGNFCAFISDGSYVKLRHDNTRSFPLWYGDHSLTNLVELDEVILATTLLTISNNFTISKEYFSPHKLVQYTDDEVINKIDDILCETYEQFLTHNTLPIKVYLSGGIDTTLCWAYLDKFTKNYEIVTSNYYDRITHTHFKKYNTTELGSYWGYTRLHLWDDPTVVVSGGMGDENFLRGPYTLQYALCQFDVNIMDVIKPTDYHYEYFNLKKNQIEIQLAKDQFIKTHPVLVKKHIIGINANDHQHWHIDNTLTFTPLNDISILTTALSASKDLLIKQGRDGFINKELINRHDPSKLSSITPQKNYVPNKLFPGIFTFDKGEFDVIVSNVKSSGNTDKESIYTEIRKYSDDDILDDVIQAIIEKIQ